MNWRRVAALAVILAVLGFLLVWILPQWDQVRTAHWQISLPLLLLSAVVNWSGWLIEISLWQRLLASLGGYLPTPIARRTWFVANLTRYLPGSIWSYLSMIYLAGQAGVSREQSLSSMLLHQLYSTGVGLVLASAFVLAEAVPGMQVLILPAAVIGVVAVLLWPALPVTLLNVALRTVRQPVLPAQPDRGLVAFVLTGYLIVWGLGGLSFGLFALGVLPLPLDHLFPLSMNFVAASLIGFLSLLTPSGLGVREGALALLLSALPGSVLIPAQAAVLAVAARLWITALELVIAAWAVGGRLRNPGGLKVES